MDDVRQERVLGDVVEERVAGADGRIPLRTVGVADRKAPHRAMNVGVLRVGIIDRPIIGAL